MTETQAQTHHENRSVVVTGGGSGIGRATARAFAAAGANVLVVGRGAGALAATAEGHPSISTLVVDITSPGGPDSVVTAALERFGGLDVLVNNAALSASTPLEGLDAETLDAQLATNLRAPILLTQRALDALSERSGTVVNLSTAGSLGRRGWPGMSVYGASKVAVDFLTRTWALEFAPRGVRVVAVAPGVIDTGMATRNGAGIQEYADFLKVMRDRIPSGRVGTAEEIAWWIIQVASPQAQYANGTVLCVDGGLSVQ